MNRFFKVLKKDKNSQARLGAITTSQGIVKSPAFIPDATFGAVKHLSSIELKEVGLQIVLGNIYHLGIRPGTKLIKKLGGLHSFMDWSGPILTDSGGWQVFSLVYQHKMGRVLEKGVEFRDHLSGKKHFLSPETAIKNQLDVGSDILMVLDYPVLGKASKKDNEASVRLTSKWAKESKEVFGKSKDSEGKVLMAIIQGADSRDLRKKSFKELEAIGPFPGFGFGGPPTNKKILKFTASLIPDDRVRYLMGGDKPKEIVRAVRMGWDLFDCVIPTRNARHGLLYTFEGEIKITQSQYLQDKKPIERDCPCLACSSYSRAYLRHLFKVGEPLAKRLFTLHNLTFYTRLMKEIRSNIEKGKSLDTIF